MGGGEESVLFLIIICERLLANFGKSESRLEVHFLGDQAQGPVLSRGKVES